MMDDYVGEHALTGKGMKHHATQGSGKEHNTFAARGLEEQIENYPNFCENHQSISFMSFTVLLLLMYFISKNF
jgi:hypothetical protein